MIRVPFPQLEGRGPAIPLIFGPDGSRSCAARMGLRIVVSLGGFFGWSSLDGLGGRQ